MEYAKDEVFSIRYNEKEDKLEYPLKSKIIQKIRANKFLMLLFTIGAIFSILNVTLIIYFLELLNRL